MRMPTILKILLGNKKAAFGLAIVVTFVLMALFAPLLASNEPTQRVARPHQPPSVELVMGSNRMGHDLWAQFTSGARISLMVGFGAGLRQCALIQDRARFHARQREKAKPLRRLRGPAGG